LVLLNDLGFFLVKCPNLDPLPAAKIIPLII